MAVLETVTLFAESAKILSGKILAPIENAKGRRMNTGWVKATGDARNTVYALINGRVFSYRCALSRHCAQTCNVWDKGHLATGTS